MPANSYDVFKFQRSYFAIWTCFHVILLFWTMLSNHAYTYITLYLSVEDMNTILLVGTFGNVQRTVRRIGILILRERPFVSNKNWTQSLTLLVSCYLAAAAVAVVLAVESEARQQQHLGTAPVCAPGIQCCYPSRIQQGIQRGEPKKMTVVPQICWVWPWKRWE